MLEKNDEIFEEKTRLKAANQQLKSLNQQLTAAEQQLRAANQQLKADEQQTLQRKAELRRQYNILRVLIDNLPDLIYVKDTNSRFVVANVSAAKHIGAETSQALIGKTDHNFYPESLASKYYVDEQTIVQTGKPLINKEEPNVDATGKALWLSSSKIPVKNDDGKIIGIVGIGRDITERKEFEKELQAANQQLTANEQQLNAANQQLKAHEQQLKAANQQLKAKEQQVLQRKAELRRQYNILRALIDNLPDPIYVKDINSRFIVANVSVAKHMGLENPESLIGKTDHDLYPQGLASKYYVDEQTIIQTGKPLINQEEPNIDANGNTMWFSSSKIPVKDDEGKIIGIVGISRNITERKQFEQELLSANQRLTANEQQLKAANQQLRAHEQQLKAANQQLKAGELQLRAANQQLIANEQQLRAVNQDLLAAKKELMVLARFPSENPNPVLRITKDGTIIFANKKAEPLLTAWETKAGKKLPKYWADFAKEVLHSGSNRYIEFDHADTAYALTFAPIAEAGYVNIYGLDISERKQIEKLLQESHDKLEQRVKERTEDIEKANEKLRSEAVEREKVEAKILDYQGKLRSMATQLSLTEEHQRKQIAETLHDDAIQTLVFLKMKISDLQELDSSRDFAQVLNQLNQQTSELIQRMRTLTFDLASPILYDLGLAAAIKDWLTREIGEKHGIVTLFKNDPATKQMDDDLKTLLYRSVKELLANAVKHAKAKNIKVSKIKSENNVVIIVEDDGIGFNPLKKELKYDVTTGGFGLFTINERLSQYNGTLDIESTPSKGTKITLTAPLKFPN